MKIAFVGAQNAPHEIACTHWSGIRASAKRLEHDLRIFCCRSGQEFIDDIVEWKPDILVYNLIDMAENTAWREILRFKLPSTKIVFWYADCRTNDTGQIYANISGTVDLFLTSSDGHGEFHKKHFGMTPQWLPQAAEPLDKPVIQDNARFEFLFIGGKINRGGFEERMKIIDQLEKNNDLKVLNGRTPEERAKVYNAMPALYGSSVFNLDISHFWHIPKYTSNRYWVIPAYFGFCLTKRFPDHEMLVPETHHVYWDTVDELMDKMLYYKEHENERQEMILKGWEYAKAHHTYEHRIRRIIELL